MKTFKDYLNEKVSQDDMINALYKGTEDNKFTQDMYDWFQDNYPDAPIYGGDATPEEFVELLDKENDSKMIAKFYNDMIKKHKKAMNEAINEKEYDMDEDAIRQAMAESGKMKVAQLMSYMKAKYAGKYDLKLARENAKELVADM